MLKNTSTYFKGILLCTVLVLVSNVCAAQIIEKDSQSTTRKSDLEANPLLPVDTTSNPIDTTINSNNYTISVNALDCVVIYSADSSHYVRATKVIELYGNASVKYCEMDLAADQISYNTETGLAEAFGERDSLGNFIGFATFSDGTQEVQYKSMKYNFKTEKGTLAQIVTRQGEGLVTAEKIKKINDDSFFAQNTHYTTCDLENPHYYFTFNKAKVVNDKLAAGKNLNLYIKDIPTPIYFPFGIFPLQQGKRSGLLRPRPGFDQQRGFELENIGWYQPINDNMDALAAMSIYTTGSWRLDTDYNYVKRYKFRTNLSLSINKNKNITVSDAVGVDFTNSFQFRWNFNQDAKAWPNANFNASVQLGQSNFKRQNVFNAQDRLNNTYTSSINFTKTFPNLPVNFSSNIRYNQNTQSNAVSLTLPNINLSTSTLYPFRGLSKTGKSGFLENINMRYTSRYQNQINSVDSVFFGDPFGEISDGRYGASHSIPVSANFKLLKYLNFSQGLQYNEIWTSETYRRTYDLDLQREVVDTVSGFRTARWYTPSAGFATTLYGVKEFKKGKLKAIRHVIRPTVNFSYNPDFTNVNTSQGPYFQEVQTNAQGDTRLYSVFDGGLFGGPPINSGGSIGFGLNNNLEMKIASDKDTSGYKKIKIFETLNLNSSYDLDADSLNWSNIRVSGNTKLLKKISLNMSANFNPYAIDTTTGRRIDRAFLKENKGLADLTNFTFRMSGSLNSKKSEEIAPEAEIIPNPLYPTEQIFVDNYTSNNYVDFSIPWDLNLAYSFSYSKRYSPGNIQNFSINQGVTGGGNFNVTDNWKMNLQSGYDIRNKEINYTNIQINRNLHCWQMGFNWSVGTFSRYAFFIQPKSSLLQGLKLDKKRTYTPRFKNP